VCSADEDERRPAGGRARLWWWPVAIAVARTPRLWCTALVQARRLAPRGWWHRWPPRPLPDPDYLQFRSQTMYGGDARSPEPADVLSYLWWCKNRG